jgi:hypothetical protein
LVDDPDTRAGEEDGETDGRDEFDFGNEHGV